MIISPLCPPAIRSLYMNQLSGLVSHLYYFDSIDSTNTFLAQLKASSPANTAISTDILPCLDTLPAPDILKSCMVCIAEEQTKGRGRGGHVWHSSHQDIFFSLRFTVLPSVLEGFSLCVALSCVRTLEQLGFEGLAIKWPNDIFFVGKKCGGILIECIYQPDRVTVIVGVGFNMANQLHEAVKTHASSLYDAMILNGYDKERLRILLIKGLIDELLNNFLWKHEPDSQNYFRDFLSTYWPTYDFCRGKRVKVINASTQWVGVMHGVDFDGSIILKTESEWVKLCAGSLMLLD